MVYYRVLKAWHRLGALEVKWKRWKHFASIEGENDES